MVWKDQKCPYFSVSVLPNNVNCGENFSRDKECEKPLLLATSTKSCFSKRWIPFLLQTSLCLLFNKRHNQLAKSSELHATLPEACNQKARRKQWFLQLRTGASSQGLSGWHHQVFHFPEDSYIYKWVWEVKTSSFQFLSTFSCPSRWKKEQTSSVVPDHLIQFSLTGKHHQLGHSHARGISQENTVMWRHVPTHTQCSQQRRQ